jgi:hypothetical protein
VALFCHYFYFFILSLLHLLTTFGPPQHTPTSASRQNLFAPLVLRFRRENIRYNKKYTACLLVWGKDSYTERFLALLPCTYVLQPTLVHLYQNHSLLPSSLTIVASASLRLLYSFLYSEYMNYIQVLYFLLFPYAFHVHSLLILWCMSNNIAAFSLGL